MTRTFPKAGLFVIALTAFALPLLLTRAVLSQVEKPDDKPWPVEGAWKLIEQKNGDAQNYEKPPEGTEMIKYITGGRFIWTVVKEGRILSAAGGKYSVGKDKYTEIIEYVHGDGAASLAGKSFDFTWKVDGNTWVHAGTIVVDNQSIKIDEKWERCK